MFPQRNIPAFLYRLAIYSLLAFASLTTVAQGQGNNWVFGVNAGIRFEPNPVPYSIYCDTREPAASISDKNGNLLLYISQDSNNVYCIYDSNGTKVTHGDSIQGNFSITNGFLILPVSENRDTTYYSILHIGSTNPCPHVRCNYLYETKVVLTNDTIVTVLKNKKVSSIRIQEHLKAIKHSNGRDWWIFTREMGNDVSDCTNQILVYLVKGDRLMLNSTYNIGTPTCFNENFIGEIAVSQSGDMIALLFAQTNIIDLFTFNRCSGKPTEFVSLSVQSSQYIYGTEFSPSGKLLYVTDLGFSTSIARLLQFNLEALNIGSSEETIVTDSAAGVSFGQLESGADNRIYLASFIPFDTVSVYVKSLSSIDEPDSIGLNCNFHLNSVPLAPGAFSFYGLPNMPNYNLGATSIFQADAGVDSFYCAGDTSIKALPIGVGDTIAGVTYTWLNDVDSAQQHRPLALVKPAQSTWYYLELRDTSIQGSCTSRIDSVYIEVRSCTGIDPLEPPDFLVYPNPANDLLVVEIPGARGYIRLYNLLGGNVLEYSLLKQSTLLDVSTLPSGVFLYQVESEGKNHQGKLVVE